MPGVESMIACQRRHTSSKVALYDGQSSTTSRNISESISTGMRWAFPWGSNGQILWERLEGIGRISHKALEWFQRVDEGYSSSRARGGRDKQENAQRQVVRIHIVDRFDVLRNVHARQIGRRFCYRPCLLLLKRFWTWRSIYLLDRSLPDGSDIFNFLPDS